jgi:hypothetical protein
LSTVLSTSAGSAIRLTHPITIIPVCRAADRLNTHRLATADLLLGRTSNRLYLSRAGDQNLRNSAEKALLIGSEAPCRFRGSAASLRSDPLPAISGSLPALLAGKGAIELPASLEISDVNANLLSPGRQQLAEEILADLLAGYIATGAGTP